ncbi:MAG: hypothetical protein MJK04_11755, partial [Psychrosphaera sp.]|nr:hypothetical protein [Psychrosphaera sp.]
EPYVQAPQIEFVSAEDKLNEYMASKNWGRGWNETKRRMFVVRSEAFNVDDPAYDDAFVTKRSVYATMANMGGKAEIAEFMRTEMSAVDQLSVPGTAVYEQLNADFDKQQRKFEAQKRQVMKLMALVDTAEADSLAGVTWDDRGKALMDAVIKKLDSSFDAGKISADKLKKYQQAKQRYTEAVTEMERLGKAAQAIKGQVKQETLSSVDTLARAPIFGATVLAQAESYNAEEQLYEVAVLMVWSHKLETSARALMTGEVVKLKAKAGVTIEKWIAKQDLSTMVGSRQLIDENGERSFIGVYSTPYSKSASARRKAKSIADLMAKKAAVMAVYADLETHKQAQIATQTRNAGLGDNDRTAVADSFAEATRQAVENRQISGLSKVLGKAVKHPISGQLIYVSAYAISGNSAKQALALEAKSYQNQLAVIGAQQTQKGIQAGYQQAVETAKASTVNFAKGKAQAQGNVAAQPAKPVSKKVSKKTAATHGATQSSAVLNVDDVDEDDF